MNGVFISYRREDTEGFARSLFQSLVAHFGKEQVFMDVEGIELGLDFVEAIDKSLSACGVLLVLIGKDWVSGVDSAGRRRLDNPEDFVRLEVARALERNIRVIPILVRGTAMPDPQDLPDDLRGITRRQALELRHDHWDSDVSLLIDALVKALGLPPKKDEPVAVVPTPKAKSGSRWGRWVVGFVVAVLVIAFLADDYETEPLPSETTAPPVSVYEEPPPPVSVREEPLPPVVYKEPPVVIPEPPQAIPEPPWQVFEEDLVFEAQELLEELGYAPGPVDGRFGERTGRAIVAFQRDHGLAPTGQVSEGLIEALYEALDRQEMLIQPPPPPSYPTAITMSGVWFDEDGVRYHIVQQGTQIQYQAFDMYGTMVAMGEGLVNGRQVDYVLVGVDGSQWRGQGMLSGDGRQMEYRVVNLMNGLQDGGLIRREDAIR